MLSAYSALRETGVTDMRQTRFLIPLPRTLCCKRSIDEGVERHLHNRIAVKATGHSAVSLIAVQLAP